MNKALELAMSDIAKQRESSTLPFTFFSDDKDIVTYHNKRGFYVQIDPDVLRMMHLPTKLWLPDHESIIATDATTMKPYKRSHFYIHCDCVDYHYINNNVSDLIKTVTNNAALDEKVLLTFHDPHYYVVARRHTSSINMYITDGLFDNILYFNREVVYTLHFRKCRSL